MSCEILSTFLSAIIGGALTTAGGILILHFEWEKQKSERLREKQCALCEDVSLFFYSLLEFVGEASGITKEFNGVNPRADWDCWNDVEHNWRAIESRFWLLEAENREQIYEIYRNISNGEHSTEYRSVREEVDAFMDKLKKDIW